MARDLQEINTQFHIPHMVGKLSKVELPGLPQTLLVLENLCLKFLMVQEWISNNLKLSVTFDL